jgi:hypothetical protein
MRKAPQVYLSQMPKTGQNDKVAVKVIDYEKFLNSAVCSTDRLKIEVSAEEAASLKAAMQVISSFEILVLAKFAEVRGYSACDARQFDTFKEINFSFKDGFVVASIRSGSVG